MAKDIYHARQDPKYAKPYLDIDEMRERIVPDGTVLTYRHIHGGFAGTGVKFLFCYPPKESFRGRFFQYLSPFPGPNEELASLDKTGEDDKIAFALANGAYYVETNMGAAQVFGANSDSRIVFRSSAAAAEFSRDKAMEIYGCTRPYGYVYGGSGGGYKTMACIENTDAWDGAAPYVIGSPVSLPNTITMRAQGQRCLRNAFDRIADALDAGGSGDPYAGLTSQEAATLQELTNMGIPPRSWFLEAAGKVDPGSLPVLLPIVRQSDPDYFRDFWSVPGYLGADPGSSASCDRLFFTGIIRQIHLCGQEAAAGIDGRNGVDDAWKKQLSSSGSAWIELEEIPADIHYWGGTEIHIQTGAAAGKVLALERIEKSSLIIGMTFGADDPADVLSVAKPGDQVLLDNSDFVAIGSYYRHQVPADPAFHAWDQFRNSDGTPNLPQRPNVLGYSMTGTGTVQDGNIQGKVIVTQALMDESTCPWCGDWYRKKVAEAKGSDADIRLYYMDRCLHGDVASLSSNMVVNYIGALHQALLDLSDWVERGIEPLPSTQYTVVNNQILPAKGTAQCGGMQPAIELLANGQSCARVHPGEQVEFTVSIQVPGGAGAVTTLEYDTDDVTLVPSDGCFQNRITFSSTGNGACARFSHCYTAPGKHMASVRVKVNRHGNPCDLFTQVQNIARVRVIVEE